MKEEKKICFDFSKIGGIGKTHRIIPVEFGESGRFLTIASSDEADSAEAEKTEEKGD